MSRSMGWLVFSALSLALALASPLCAQNVTMGDVFAGKVAPLTLTLKDCTDGWGLVTNNGPQADSIDALVQMLRRMVPGDLAETVYLTKGQIVTIGNKPYLVTYQLTAVLEELVPKVVELSQAQYTGDGRWHDQRENFRQLSKDLRWTPQTQLQLSLLDLTITRDLRDIRKFDLQQTLKVNNPISKLIDDLLGPIDVATERARIASMQANQQMIRNAVEQFRTDTGVYPATLTDLTVARAAQVSAATQQFRGWTPRGWHGPYLTTADGAISDAVRLPANPFVDDTVTTPDPTKVETHWRYTVGQNGAEYQLSPATEQRLDPAVIDQAA